MTRSTRTLIAIVLWLLAGFIAINNITQSADLGAWLVPIILFVVGLILSLYPEGEAVVDAEHVSEPAAVIPPTSTPVLEEPARQPAPVVAQAPAPEPVAAVEPAPEPEPTPVVEPDDLTKVSGIGPKMRDALYAAGITTFAKLGASTEAELLAAIEAAGMRLSRNLDTWPAQARELADQ